MNQRSALKCLPEWLLLLAAPAAAFFLLRLTPINQMQQLDAYIYAGYANNFSDLVQRFGATYYSVRMGYLVPAAAARKLAGPVAGYLLLTYLFALLASVPVYLVARKTYGRTIAAYACVAFLASVWLARSLLWTYVNAAVVSYLTCALSLILLDSPNRRFTYLVVGMLVTAAVHAHIFVAPMAALLVLPYVLMNRGRLSEVGKPDAVWLAAGALAANVLLVGAFRWTGGSWNVLGPTLRMIESLGSEVAAPSGQHAAALLTERFLLFPVAVGLLAAAWLQLSRPTPRPRPLIASLAYAAACTAFFLMHVAAGTPIVLGLPIYFSYLLPAVLTCSILLVCDVLANSAGSRAIAVACASAGLIVSAWAFHAFVDSRIPGLVPVALVASSLFFLAFARRYRFVAVMFAACWSVLSQMCFFDGYHAGEVLARGAADRSRAIELDLYRVAIRIKDLVVQHSVRNGSDLRFWYNSRRGPYDRPGNALNALDSINAMFLWGYSRLQGVATNAPGMPALGGAEMNWLSKASPGSIVLLAYSSGEIHDGQRALEQAGIAVHYELQDKVCSGSLCVDVAIGTVGRRRG